MLQKNHSKNVSKCHSNRHAYNWLAYQVNDKFLLSCQSLYKGNLYDLGAGESPYKEFFLETADRYYAVDWTTSYHNTNVDISADLNDPLPINDAAADTVVSLSVLEHLREPQKFLKEAYRILKPGGALVMQVPWQWWIHEAPHDFFRYTPYGLRYFLEKAGFCEVKIEPQTGFFSMMILKANYFSLRLIRGPRPVQWILRRFLGVIWYVGQKSAPVLDKLDRQWELESSGYFVTAKKH